jgi:hypothetical protein
MQLSVHLRAYAPTFAARTFAIHRAHIACAQLTTRTHAHAGTPLPAVFVPSRRGRKVPEELVEALLSAMAKDIQVSNIKGRDMYAKIVASKLQQLFRSCGLPHKSRAYLWEKLRARFPDVCRGAKATDGRDHLRILWTTVDNLNLWHIGCVVMLACCTIITVTTATLVGCFACFFVRTYPNAGCRRFVCWDRMYA